MFCFLYKRTHADQSGDEGRSTVPPHLFPADRAPGLGLVQLHRPERGVSSGQRWNICGTSPDDVVPAVLWGNDAMLSVVIVGRNLWQTLRAKSGEARGERTASTPPRSPFLLIRPALSWGGEHCLDGF